MTRYREGSRLQQMWAAYEEGGAEACRSLGPSLNLAPTTIKSWARTWDLEKERGGPKPKLEKLATLREQPKASKRAKVLEQSKNRERANTAEDQPESSERADTDEQPKPAKRARLHKQTKNDQRAKAEQQPGVHKRAKADDKTKLPKRLRYKFNPTGKTRVRCTYMPTRLGWLIGAGPEVSEVKWDDGFGEIGIINRFLKEVSPEEEAEWNKKYKLVEDE